jgi:predicted permease
MKPIRTFLARVAALFTDRRAHSEFSEEVEEHIRLLTERFQARGMSVEQAARAARLQFGNAALVEQRHRERRAFLSPHELWRDACFGARMLRKRPGATLGVVIALTLGIGMNACVFTFVNSLLLRPPAGVSEPGQLRELWERSRSATGGGLGRYLPFTYPDYAYYRDHMHSLSGLIAFDGDSMAVLWNRAGQGDVARVEFVSGNFFSISGVGIPLGRGFSQEDDQPGNPRPVVVLSHNFWSSRLGADRSIVGHPIVFNGISFTVVGVTPPGFNGFIAGVAPDFYTPISMVEQTIHDPGRLSNRSSMWLIVDGRLAPGATTATMLAEASVLAHEIELAHPDTNKDLDAAVFTYAPLPGPVRGYVMAFTGLLMTVFGLVLVIACVNAASLLMVKATGRAREMAIRSALGAGRGRLIRQMTVESLLLSLIAAFASLALSAVTSRLLLRLVPANLPISVQLPVDWRVVAFTFSVALLTGIAFGAMPALRGTRVDPVRVLKDEMYSGSYRKSRLRAALMTGQVALCALLLFCAALCVRSLLNANSINPGFETRNIATAELDPSSLGYSDAKVTAFYRDLTARVRALPGVVSASWVNHLPLDASREATSIRLESSTLPKESAMIVDVFRVAPQYFTTMGIPMLRGRDFTQDEFDRNASPIVINDTLAAKLFAGADPLGKLVRTGGSKVPSEVIAIVPTGKYRTLGELPTAVLYRLELPASRVLVVRTTVSPAPMLDVLRRETQLVDPKMAASSLQTIGDFMSFPLFPARTTGLLLGAAGILALVLTWIGLFGVISFAVSQRTREIGVRMALGARRADVLKLVIRQGLFVTAIGLTIGVGSALVAARPLTALLYQIRPDDPATITGVVVGLTAIILLACYLPARRAMRVNPTVALRYE